MGRKNRPAQSQVGSLRVAVEDAERQIRTQIEEGSRIQNRTFQSHQDLDTAERDRASWSEYNSDLLRHLFTDESAADQYDAHILAMAWQGETFAEEVEQFRGYIGEQIRRLESIAQRLHLRVAPGATEGRLVTSSSADRPAVFVVHGHDRAARVETENYLRRIELEPIVLQDQPNMGRTVIEKFEAYADVDYSIVLMTPDDVGRKNDPGSAEQTRARQNVIFELGYFIGRLGRGKVCLLYKPEPEIPSDLHGVVYISLDDPEWKIKLLREFRVARIAFNERRT